MLSILRGYAEVPVRDPMSVVEDPALQVPAANAYNLGKVDGKVELAKAILEDLARGE